MDSYKCGVCGYTYHEGNEDAETPFSELPTSWTCPLCSAAKAEFKRVENLVEEEAVL